MRLGRVSRTTVGLTLLSLVGMAHAAAPDAEQLLQRGRQVAAGAQTLRADLVVVARNGDTATGTLTAMRPNLFRLRFRGANGETEVCSDGKNVFYSYPASRGYVRLPMEAGVESTRFLDALCPPAVAFFNPDQLTQPQRVRATGPMGVATSVAHEQYSGVELLGGSPQVRSWYFNDAGFPAGATFREGDMASVWVQNLRLGAPLRPQDFQFELPAGQRSLLPGEAEEGLRPVGTRLPDFSLAEVGGYRVSLAELRTQSKAILIYHGTPDSAASRQDMPLLRQLAERLGKQVRVLALFPAGAGPTRSNDRETGTGVMLLRDETGSVSRAARPTGGGNTPATYLIDAEGRILWAGHRPTSEQIQKAIPGAR